MEVRQMSLEPRGIHAETRQRAARVLPKIVSDEAILTVWVGRSEQFQHGGNVGRVSYSPSGTAHVNLAAYGYLD